MEPLFPIRPVASQTPTAVLVIEPYRHEGAWVFDEPRVGLHREPFAAGVSEMIDRLVAGIPDAARGFRLLFADFPFEGHQAVLSWVRADPVVSGRGPGRRGVAVPGVVLVLPGTATEDLRPGRAEVEASRRTADRSQARIPWLLVATRLGDTVILGSQRAAHVRSPPSLRRIDPRCCGRCPGRRRPDTSGPLPGRREIDAEYHLWLRAGQEAEQARMGPEAKVAMVIYSTG